MSWVVLKFGGTSVATRPCWEAITSIIEERQREGLRPLVVCSAVAGVSNAIEELLKAALTGRHAALQCEIEERHRALARELGVDAGVIGAPLEELARLVEGASLVREITPRTRARAMACGELLSTALGAAFLKGRGVAVAWHDARDHLLARADPHVGEERHFLAAGCGAEPDPDLHARLDAERAPVIVTQGFIARDAQGETVLLGRGGSDTSASSFSAKLSAARCEIWSDVPGMFTANPHQVPSARLIRTLAYDEAQEIASAGAKVLHPRCIMPLAPQRIPLHLKCLAKPHLDGTVISADAGGSAAQVKAIAARRGITLISMETVDMWQQVGFLAEVFERFRRHGLSVDLVSTSETNVTVTLDRAANVADQAAIDALVSDLSAFCHARAIGSVGLVSLVGRNIRAMLHELAPALEVFQEQRVYLLSQAASDLNLTFVVDEDQIERLVRQLHDQLFRRSGNESVLGPTWDEIFGQERAQASLARPEWWRTRRGELLALARERSPRYVYDAGTIDRTIAELKGLSAIDRIFYAVKANAFPKILQRVSDAGLGFECVSPGELEYIVGMFGGIDPSRLLFTPNFAPRAEYERALALGAQVTLDNLHPLEAWGELFRGRELFVRVDPGQGRGHHKYVRTAGAKAKFGVSPGQLERLRALADAAGARIVGLHAHVGSNIFAPETWSRNALFLASVAAGFPDVRVLNLGGGLGVVEKPGQAALDLAAVDVSLMRVRAAHPRFAFWIEPGRFLVAEAGVLLATVTQTKQKEEYRYVGVDAGMNTLIRPALYGAHHEIVNLSRLGEPGAELVNVVGPICESGDILGYERFLPACREGDLLLVANAGAYGRVMSSRYNMREPAEEYFLEPSAARS